MKNTDTPTTWAPAILEDLLLKLLTKACGKADICKKLGVTDRVLKAVLADLKEAGYVFAETNETVMLCRSCAPEENIYELDWQGDKIIRFGVVSDTHLCNKWQQLTHLNNIYDIFTHEGIDTVYHAGDVTDGYYKNRAGHIYELFRVGADEQSEYVVKNYPCRPGLTTKFITGNHDATHIINGGANVGIRIAKDRADMEYLGMDNAKIKLTPNCTLEVNHPGDGSAYALSYALQKLIDSMQGGEKPNVLINGHHHKAFFMPTYRNILSYEAATFEAQTPWMKGRKIASHVGGWIIELRVDDGGTIKRCITEFFPYYKMLKNDY
jgi:predicted phosphodiesterase